MNLLEVIWSRLNHGNKGHSIRNIVKPDGSYTCGEHSITCRPVESLCCAAESNVTLCVSYTPRIKISSENRWGKQNSDKGPTMDLNCLELN